MKDKGGRQIDLYPDSQALLIGVSRYTRGWPKLESVPGEIDSIEAALKNNISSNRLLFYYSGHGYSRESPAQGYLVPADARNRERIGPGFSAKP